VVVTHASIRNWCQLVAHRLTDLSAGLATVGSRDATFPLPHGRGDQVTHAGGGSNPRELPPKGLRTRDIYIPDLHIDTIKVTDVPRARAWVSKEAAGRLGASVRGSGSGTRCCKASKSATSVCALSRP
jgi:hypothetical protein